MTRPFLLTLGHGYSAAALAASLGADWDKAGTTRAPERAAAMRAAGVEPVPWDDAAAVEAAIARASHVVASAPPDAAGDPALARHGRALARRGAWVGYLSTTGVYGDRGGAWVDEASALRPANARSLRRAAAERAWRASGAPVEIFRLAGIYGPGRSVFDRLRAGRAQRLIKPGQVFSRIHVEDIAGALRAAMAAPLPGEIWNLADDEPAPPQDVVAYAAGLVGLPPPPETPFEAAILTPMARSFWSESKRVSNLKLKARPGFALRHPDYRAGLRAVLAAGG